MTKTNKQQLSRRSEGGSLLKQEEEKVKKLQLNSNTSFLSSEGGSLHQDAGSDGSEGFAGCGSAAGFCGAFWSVRILSFVCLSVS